MSSCPKCGGPLTSAVVDDGGGIVADTCVLACHGCGGVWLDIEMMQQLVKGILGRRVLDTAEAMGEADRAPTARPYREGPTGACPICAQALSRVTTSRAQHGIDGIELDLCGAHGTWFDPHELVTISEALDLRRQADQARAARRRAELNAEVNAAYPRHAGLEVLGLLFPETAHARIVRNALH